MAGEAGGIDIEIEGDAEWSPGDCGTSEQH